MVSAANVELARRFYPAPLDLAHIFAEAGRLTAQRAALEPLVHEDFETVADPRYQMLLGDPGASAGGSSVSVYVGIDGFISGFREWLTGWDSWVITPRDFIDSGDDRVFVGINMVGKSKAQAIEIESDGGNVLTFRDRRLERLELFFRREDALEAAGLAK